MSAVRYAALTMSALTTVGGVASNTTRALSAPWGVTVAAKPLLSSEGFAGGRAVTVSGPSTKPYTARITNVASQLRPVPNS